MFIMSDIGSSLAGRFGQSCVLVMDNHNHTLAEVWASSRGGRGLGAVENLMLPGFMQAVRGRGHINSSVPRARAVSNA